MSGSCGAALTQQGQRHSWDGHCNKLQHPLIAGEELPDLVTCRQHQTDAGPDKCCP